MDGLWWRALLPSFFKRKMQGGSGSTVSIFCTFGCPSVHSTVTVHSGWSQSVIKMEVGSNLCSNVKLLWWATLALHLSTSLTERTTEFHCGLRSHPSSSPSLSFYVWQICTTAWLLFLPIYASLLHPSWPCPPQITCISCLSLLNASWGTIKMTQNRVYFLELKVPEALALL